MNFPWIILGVLTLLRLVVAVMGHLSETESYLLLCSQHLDWGFVEGPAGVPALLRVSSGLFGITPLGVRWMAPLFMLIASWSLWRLTLSLCNGDRKIAFWTVVAFNFLPLANAAALVMDGTIIAATCWIVAFQLAWELLSTEPEKNTSLSLQSTATAKSFVVPVLAPSSTSCTLSCSAPSAPGSSSAAATVKIGSKILSWFLFGIILALGTQVTYLIGCLLPLVLMAQIVNKNISKNFLGVALAVLLLSASWFSVLWWNASHDWMQWDNITWDSFWLWPPATHEFFSNLSLSWMALIFVPLLISGCCCFSGRWTFKSHGPFFLLASIPLFFCINALGHDQAPFALLLVLSAIFLPSTIELFFKTRLIKQCAAGALFLMACCSIALLLNVVSLSTASESSWNFSTAEGVTGVKAVTAELSQLRKDHLGASGKLPFIVAQTPGLAAVLGAELSINYPELKDAPPVFIPESPALMSQFLLWPHYADATVANTTPDPLYTEEKAVSPFLGYDAFYITTEKLEEIPQTMSGAFVSITPLNATLSITKNGQQEQLFLYFCQSYQMMSL